LVVLERVGYHGSMVKARPRPITALPPLPRVRVPHPHVRCDARLLGGSPHVVGTRVPVRRLWAWHRAGTSIDTLLKRYPSLGPARVLDALAFCYDNRDVVEADLGREIAAFEAAGKKAVGLRPMAQQELPFLLEPRSELEDEPEA
jgi:uncharacterized protein (DUF433 family)